MLEMLKVGNNFPGWEGPYEGSELSILNSGLLLLSSLPDLLDEEVRCFQKLKAYGIYQNDQYRFGHMLWQFGDGLILETPFNPEKEKEIRFSEVKSFLSGKKNIMTGVLIDEKGIIRSLNFAGLKWQFIQTLQETWSDPTVNWNKYDYYLGKLSRRSIQNVWNESKHYIHSPI